VALAYNWWGLFVRLADPEHHREALTSRSLLLSAIARRTQHAGQVTQPSAACMACATRLAGPVSGSRASWPSYENAEKFDPVEKWYRILSEALTPSDS
jgi:hypothetical protein